MTWGDDTRSEPVAVIGFAGRFPGARDTEELWRNLAAGRDTISRPDDEALRAAGVPEEDLAHPDYVRAVALLPEADGFDTELFGMTPREAALHSPQHRLFLETAHAALENAGYDPFAVPGPTAVFGGASASGYLQHHLWGNPAVSAVDTMSLGIANNNSYIPTLTSYKLSLVGPSVAVSTACSTSLVALHLAADSLRNGACRTALAGGVELEFPYGHGYRWAPGSAYSRDGYCRPFDARATGTVFGSGVGVVVLKLLRHALEDGDTVRAVIRGSAVNNDGSDKVSFSAPSVSGQAAVISAAMADAGVRPADIGYVEAHGTGTPLGDLLEVTALTEAYTAGEDAPRPGSIPLGSVKSNVGHLGPAAGVTGLIKVVLAMEHEHIPATLHFASPNPRIDFSATPFVVADTARPWPRVDGRPRLAAVSSFGIGGTNAHVIVEEPPPAPARPDRRPRPQLLVWSGASEAALAGTAERLGAYFAERRAEDVPLEDVAHTLQTGRHHHAVRAAAVCADAAEAATVLRSGGRRVLRRTATGDPRELCLVFPGQGAQRPAMAAGLYQQVDTYAEVFDECLDLFAEHGVELREVWRDGDEAALAHTAVAQPLLFAVEYALTQALLEAGVRPSALVGHSVGELVAATVAGVLDPVDAVALVAARGRHMAEMPEGAMLAVAASPEELGSLPEGLSLAAVNGPRQSVLSGPAELVDAQHQELAATGVTCRRLPTSHAFHSPAMAEAARRFEDAVARVELRPPAVRLVSAATGRELTEDEARSPRFWARQLCEPVRFDEAVGRVLAAGPAMLLEVGPARTLSQVLGHRPEVIRGESQVVPVSPPVPGEEADLRAFLTALGQVHVEGHQVTWPTGGGSRRVPLPGYAYQRRRYWIDRADRPEAATSQAATTEAGESEASVTAAAAGAPAAGTAAAPTPGGAAPGAAGSPFSAVTWTEAPLPAGPTPRVFRRTLALLPAATERALPLLGALTRAGHHVVRVRQGDRLVLGEEEFVVRPDEPDDLARVVAELHRRGHAPHLYVHAWATEPWERPSVGNAERQVAAACLSLLALLRSGAERTVDGALPAFVVLTSGAVDVTGDEEVHPVKATALGVVATFAQEAPTTRCRVIDLGARWDEAALVDELALPQPPVVTALRGTRRWVRHERPLAVPAAGDGPAVRDQGVYLITGGLGGLGLEVAKGLARTGRRPRLVLLGRRVPDGARPLPAAAASRVRTALTEMAALGAQVRVVECDVADAARTREVLEKVWAEFGPLDGVVHSAGVAGDGIIQLRSVEQARAVLRPKVTGTLVLAELLARQRPLDFFVAFSSRAGTHGLVGSGDYAAANAFLDACAATFPGSRRWLSIGWPSWREVGMAAPSASAPAAAAPPAESREDWTVRLAETVSADTHWVLDEHRIDGVPVMPGTGQLDTVLRAWRDTAGRGAVRLEEVTFLRPLVVEEETRVQVLAKPDPDRGVERFVVRSCRSDDPSAAWTEHTTGAVRLVQPRERRVDLADLEAEIREEQAPPEPEGEDASLVSVGPRWDNLGRAVRGADSDLVELVLPEEFVADLPDHVVHPALLDGATAFAQRTTPVSRLPLHYEALTVYRSLPSRFWAHLRYREAGDHVFVTDVDLVDPDGTLLVSVQGFTMRRVEGDVLTPEPRRDAATDGEGTTAPAGRPSPGAVSGTEGLPPQAGVELFLRLLQGRTPPHVLVRPHDRGEPVPLAEPTAAVGTGAAPVAPATPRVTADAPAAVSPALPGPTAPAPGRPVDAPAATDLGAGRGGTPSVDGAPVDGPAPEGAAGGADAAGTGPAAEGGDGGADEVKETLRSFLAEVIGTDTVGDDDDFFELGGTSLTAIQLLSQIREHFQVELTIAGLFEHPTVARLAEALHAQREERR